MEAPTHGKDDAPPAHHSPAKSPVVVREVDLKAPNIIEGGDVYVLDRGVEIWQLNTTGAVGKEKFKAAEFCRNLADHPDRKGRCEVHVFGTTRPTPSVDSFVSLTSCLSFRVAVDQGSAGSGKFFAAIGGEPTTAPHGVPLPADDAKLLRLSEEAGQISFAPVDTTTQPTYQDLTSSDTFLLDCSSLQPSAIYVWIGSQSSAGEKRLALQYAQKYLHDNGLSGKTSIIKVAEGSESDAFLKVLSS